MPQRKYTFDLLKVAGKLGGMSTKTPLEDGYKILREGKIEDNQLFEDFKLYRRTVS